MKLSEQLKRDHESGDYGVALEGYAERAEALEQGIRDALEWGWLYDDAPHDLGERLMSLVSD